MKAKVTKAFLAAPDGVKVVEIQPGEVLEGQLAADALSLKVAEEVKDEAPPAEKPAEPKKGKK